MDEQTQQQLTVTGASRAGLEPAELWVAYYALGGSLSQLEMEAYLIGVQVMAPLERDILAHTLNEILQDDGSAFRVPYSADAYAPSGGAAVTDEEVREAVQALESLGAAGASFLGPGRAEVLRAQAVGRTGLVDSAAEERFDRITRKAQEYFGVSSASVALIDERRQFLKSVIGPLGQNTPRDIALCNETIRRAGPLIVPDTLTDPRFKTNPLVTGEPHIRFYAGFPLFGPAGWAIGTFCVIDQHPRDFSMEDQQELRAMALSVQHEINGQGTHPLLGGESG